MNVKYAADCRRRGPIVLASLAAVMGLAVAVPPATTASGDTALTTGQQADTAGSTQVSLDGVSPGAHVITLITGDRVTLSGAGAVDVQPAARPDGELSRFFAESGPEGVYVIPSDVQPAIDAGHVDRELFNVEYLAAHGFADGESKQLPVIVQYGDDPGPAELRSQADAVPASAPTATLASIDAAALTVPKLRTDDFWAALRKPAAAPQAEASPTLRREVEHVWLDREMTVSLDESVPLIGAPQAWEAGFDGTGVKVAILDTGIDATHPDLQGKVVASQGFVSDTVVDGNGHGTHVASTIVGSGAASGGQYKGVAQGADLAIGKVCDDAGQCPTSALIDGMEWATQTQDADIVSMSLGGGPTDGTDPQSQAVNQLTASTGALFVVAAGNRGPGTGTVGTPGTADAALTVAATDKTDGLASFSSRGPRLDGALKPDIAAPGVNIVAASANNDDTSICRQSPVACLGNGYMRISGTSMATPHVSGAAAILKQQHPAWEAAQLKAALMSTSHDAGHTVYEQGAGRVDIARAVSQQVFATTPNLDFGQVDTGQSELISRQVTYTNMSGQDVTLTLEPTLSSLAGDPAPDGALTVDDTATVPAGGTATTTVSLDPSGLELTDYSGALVATDDASGTRLTTPIGLSKLAPLTIHIVNDRPFGGRLSVLPVEFEDSQAATATAASVASTEFSTAVQGTAAGGQPGTTEVFEATISAFVPSGTYSAMAFMDSTGVDDLRDMTSLAAPQFSVTGATEITLDARQAKQITFTTPRPTYRVRADLSMERTAADGNVHTTATLPVQSRGDALRLWATPTERVTKGIFRYATQVTLSNPQLTMTVNRPEQRRLGVLTNIYADADGRYVASDFWVPFTNDRTVRLVDAGFGDPDDIAGLDLHGKLVLLRYGEPFPGGHQCRPFTDRAENVRHAGAVGVIYFPISPPGACKVPADAPGLDRTGNNRPMKLPAAWLTRTEGQHLADQAAKDTVLVDVNADPNVRYTYELKEYEEEQISSSLDYTITRHDVAQIDTVFHASDPEKGYSVWHAFKPMAGSSFSNQFFFAWPHARPVYVGPLSSDVVWSVTSEVLKGDANTVRFVGPRRVFDRPIRTSEQRNSVPLAPGVVSLDAFHDAHPDDPASVLEACQLCREGDTIWAADVVGAPLMTGNGQAAAAGAVSGPTTMRLFRADGEEIPVTPQGPFQQPGFTLPEQPDTYRLAEDAPLTNGSTVGTTWTFTSPGTPQKTTAQPGYACYGALWGSTEACQPEPIVFLGYDLGDSVGLDNTVAAPGQSKIQVRAYHAQSTEQMPSIAGLKLWASTDDGAHWQQLKVSQTTSGPEATFNATITYPALAGTSGAVSLKAEAWDTAGNRIEQTLTRAYGLRD